MEQWTKGRYTAPDAYESIVPSALTPSLVIKCKNQIFKKKSPTAYLRNPLGICNWSELVGKHLLRVAFWPPRLLPIMSTIKAGKRQADKKLCAKGCVELRSTNAEIRMCLADSATILYPTGPSMQASCFRFVK